MTWKLRLSVVLVFLLCLFIGSGARVETQAPFLVFGSQNGLPVAIKATGNALWVSLAGGTVASGQLLLPDGTAPLPALAFASEPTLGFWRSAAGTITAQGAFSVTGAGGYTGTFSALGPNILMGSTTGLVWTSRARMASTADGLITAMNQAQTIGVQFKVDALPTVGSGFGTSPAVTAGSTPMAGSVNVGTGGVATTGVITFNGTAFPSAPFCTPSLSAGSVPTTYTATTAAITFTTSVAWPASTIVTWQCISSK